MSKHEVRKSGLQPCSQGALGAPQRAGDLPEVHAAGRVAAAGLQQSRQQLPRWPRLAAGRHGHAKGAARLFSIPATWACEGDFVLGRTVMTEPDSVPHSWSCREPQVEAS